MNTQKVIVTVTIIVSAIISGCSKEPQGNPAAEQAAVRAASDWLTLVDNGQNAESWQKAAEYFKTAVSQEKWQQSIQAVREPLGSLVSRELKSARYTTSIPGGPDGQYVIIQFSSSFKNKKSAVETITPMLDKDNMWKVSGYFIK